MPQVRIQDFDLLVQMGLIILLTYAYWRIRIKRSMKDHAWLFVFITLINLVSVIAVMVPLFLTEFEGIVASPLTEHSILMWAHHIIGLLVIVLSIYLLAKWRSNIHRGKNCSNRKLMNITFSLWLASALFGLVLYFAEIIR